MPNNVKQELKNIPVTSNVTKQIGVDLCSLPKVDELEHVVVCIDYFSKWSEAKPTRDKSAPTVTQFLYELTCKHECFAVQKNDQSKKFMNELSHNLHEMTSARRQVTSAYHPQSNGLVGHQN